jgi:16S rRNA (adenine1518-N6/adenine1519-N6)-dimethyltransferase
MRLTKPRRGSTHLAKKRYGQHFLHERGVIDKIVAAIDPKPGERIVEIGPGLGALTIPLLEKLGRLEVVELDRDVIPELVAAAAGKGELVVHQRDALKFDFSSLGSDLRVIGNLPYNVSTPLLFHLLAARASIRDMHFMLQKEVVERMAAAPDSDAYGRLTVMLAAYTQVQKLFRVGPGAFRPPPKVDSAVVRLVPYATPPFPLPDPQRFAQLVTAAFTKRRKTMRNAVKGLVDEAAMRAAGVDPQARPETLAAADFARLLDASSHPKGC